MWINKETYNNIRNELYKDINKERKNGERLQRELIKTSELLAKYISLDEPLILGKFFIAEKQPLGNMYIWSIYRVDRLIKSEVLEKTNKRSFIFTVHTKDNAEKLVKYLDQKIENMIENRTRTIQLTDDIKVQFLYDQMKKEKRHLGTKHLVYNCCDDPDCWCNKIEKEHTGTHPVTETTCDDTSCWCHAENMGKS